MKTCFVCKGAIFEPNELSSYSGQICKCSASAGSSAGFMGFPYVGPQIHPLPPDYHAKYVQLVDKYVALSEKYSALADRYVAAVAASQEKP